MSETFVGQVEFHLRGKRLGVRFIGNINIRYKTQNTLVLLRFELLGSNLLRGITHSNCPLHCQNTEFDFS